MKRKSEKVTTSTARKKQKQSPKHYLLQVDNERSKKYFDLVLNYITNIYFIEGFDFSKTLKNYYVEMNEKDNEKKLIFSDSYLYYGMHKNGKRHGLGICLYACGIYDGWWTNDKENIHGIFTNYAQNKIIDGDWENGNIKRAALVADGQIQYDGEIIWNSNTGSANFAGRGCFFVKNDNIIYTGLFDGDDFSGIRVSPSGMIKGNFEFENGNYFANGVVEIRYYDDKNSKTSYIGELDEFYNYDGKGVLYFNKNITSDDNDVDMNIIKYDGYFKNGLYNGYGTSYYSNGYSYKGMFVNGKLSGDYEETSKNGDVVEYQENYDRGAKTTTRLTNGAVIEESYGNNGRLTKKICYGCDDDNSVYKEDCVFIRIVKKNGDIDLCKYVDNGKTVYKLKKENGEESEIGNMDELKELIPEMNIAEKKDNDNIGKYTCRICLDGDVECLFSPCNHLVSCTKCSIKVDKCPVCRAAVENKIKIFN